MSKYSTFFNEHFFDGDTNIERSIRMVVADKEENSFKTAKLRTNGASTINLSLFPLAAGELQFLISLIDGVEATIVTPYVAIPNRSTSTLQEILTLAHEKAGQEGEEAAEEATTADEPAVECLDYVDFERIVYGRTAKSQKEYFLERLKPEAAERLGQAYRVYKEVGETKEKEFLNPAGPVYRSVVKQYEIENGLRKK